MEFMQFHPTVLYIAGSSRNLITEAMRAKVRTWSIATVYRFMPEYDDRAELAPRDIVSRAIVTQMEKTRHPNVYLDLSHLDPKRVRFRFPGIAAVCAEFGIDITRDPIPVRPGATHDRRRHGRPRRTHDIAGPVGRGRGYLERTARGEPPGIEQLARRARLWCSCGPRGFVPRQCDRR